jgi:hypothetical protein
MAEGTRAESRVVLPAGRNVMCQVSGCGGSVGGGGSGWGQGVTGLPLAFFGLEYELGVRVTGSGGTGGSGGSISMQQCTCRSSRGTGRARLTVTSRGCLLTIAHAVPAKHVNRDLRTPS